MNEEEFIEQIKTEGGYQNLRFLKHGNKKLCCGTLRMAFTTGLVIGLDSWGYYGRYCFHTKKEAEDILNSLKELPLVLKDMPGEWIKFKGEEEFSNTNLQIS